MILIEPTNPKASVSFNPLEQTKGVFPEEQAEELVGVFRKIWSDAWGHRMADVLRNFFIALIESNLTLIELPLLLTNRLVRKRILSKIKNPHCLQRFNFFNSLRPRASLTFCLRPENTGYLWEISAQVEGNLNRTTPETFKSSVEKARIGMNYLIPIKKV